MPDVDGRFLSGKQGVCRLEMFGERVWTVAFNPVRGGRGERNAWQSMLAVDMN